jgi:hypothetical protein
MNEVERTTDPGDASDYVQPANDGTQPFSEDHIQGRHPSCGDRLRHNDTSAQRCLSERPASKIDSVPRIRNL